MKALVVYDSMYGNTERIAQAVAAALGGDARAVKAGDVQPDALVGLDLLVLGSPTQGGRATKPVQEFIGSIPAGSLMNTYVAVFDTRISARDKHGFMRLLINTFGYAAGRMEKALKPAQGRAAVPPEGFIVNDSKGPLKDGELERAATWAQSIVAAMKR